MANDSEKKRVLCLGGTGVMGIYLSKILIKQGFDVYVTTRKNIHSNEVTYIIGNAHDEDFLRKVLQERHFNILVDFMIYGTNEFSNRIKLLLQNVDQYIFLSSSRVYADSKLPIKETDSRLLDICKNEDYLLTDEYALTKARQEDVLRNSQFKNWTIIRPYITYGENRFQLGVMEKESWLYRALKGHTIVFSKDIATKKTTLTYGGDVARGIASVIGKESALSQIFHITQNENNSWQQILEIYVKIIEKYIGYPPKVLLIDKCHRLNYNKYNWQIVYDRYYDRVFDNSNIRQYIDNSDFSCVEQGLEDSLTKFLEKPKFNGVYVMEQAYLDKITSEHFSLSDIQSVTQKIKYIIYRYCVPMRMFSIIQSLLSKVKSKKK